MVYGSVKKINECIKITYLHRYPGALLDIEVLKEAIREGTKSTKYTGLVSWLTGQIGLFGNFDETVHPTSSAEDASTFLLELSSFLKELGCVNSKLTSGNANQRLASVEERSILLEYLITELMTSKIIESNNKDNDKSLQITIVSTNLSNQKFQSDC